MMKKNLTINFWKVIFAIIIVLYHTVYFQEYDGYVALLKRGYIGVEFFCMISGYFMVKSSEEVSCSTAILGEETRKFLFRKIKRILPYWLISGFLCLIIRLITVDTVYLGIKQVLFSFWSFFFLQKTGLATYGLINVGWYASSMLLCMIFLYPICVRKRDIFVNIFCPIVAINVYSYYSLTFGCISVGTNWFGSVNSGTVRVLGGLCIGGVIFEASRIWKQKKTSYIQKIFFTIAEWGLMLGTILILSFVNDSRYDFIMILFMMIALVIILGEKSFTEEILKFIFGEQVSDWSTAIYLAQAPVLGLLLMKKIEIGYFKIVFIYFIFTMLLAFLSIVVVRYCKRKIFTLLRE